MPIRDSIDKHAEKASEEIEKREAAKEHLKEKGLSKPWKYAPLAAGLADAATTELSRRTAKETGIGGEANPLMRKIIEKPLLFTAIKAGLGLGAGVLADKIAKKHKTGGKIVAAAGTLPSAVATVNNIAFIKRTRGKKASGK